MTKFFTSDTHFSHKNVIKYDNRPYSSVEEMNESLIENWNKVVKPNDVIYHLGDFGFASDEDIFSIIKRLNGKKIFIVGNHDKQMYHADIRKNFESYHNYLEVVIDKIPTILFHFPINVWNKKHYGAFHIHGHVHGSKVYEKPVRAFDAGVSCNNYTPVSFEEIYQKLNSIEYGFD